MEPLAGLPAEWVVQYPIEFFRCFQCLRPRVLLRLLVEGLAWEGKPSTRVRCLEMKISHDMIMILA